MKSSGIEEGPEWAPGVPLEPPEQVLLESASAGMYLDLAGDGRVDHQAMSEWGPGRTVRAAVLRHLLVGPQGDVDSKGVRLRGARISGQLDLESVALRWPLVLEDCYLDSPEPVSLDYATAPRIALSRCRVVGGLTANLLVVTTGLNLSGSTFEGVVLLFDADITGNLACRDTKLTGSDQFGNALVGDRMKVSGSVHLDEGFTAAGAVRLAGANITGQLSCLDARITGANSDGNALDGDFMKVGSGAYLDGRFFAAGAVRLVGADITGLLSFRGAQLTGRDGFGNARAHADVDRDRTYDDFEPDDIDYENMLYDHDDGI